MKDDVISRQAAIDALCSECQGRCIPCKYYPCSEVKAINALPSAQPEPPWIPVSERLPKDGTEVFVYLFDPPSPFIAWIEDTRWYTEEFEVERENEPVAWMPLPEPYRAERRTE